MVEFRRFRFGTFSFQTTRAEVLAEAGKAEVLGYDTFQMSDHMFEMLGTIAALMMIADNFPRLRAGTGVLCNDFHHPVDMAKDAATLDVVSGGRLELGFGAGYYPLEFEMAGITFDRGLVRFERLAETVQIVKRASRRPGRRHCCHRPLAQPRAAATRKEHPPVVSVAFQPWRAASHR
jgi:alkanesulfonate monooxygenase SsuD/methylene tetrahydromethanopterin reductase-like flavin-dependent oxidoreductase (luciferase family)